ncbi:MFS transporter [Streptomyces sp. HNM0574]|uniref:MFS transporter n=1 Tax=Streptomyces sp. HNM0574 TaxID=2714954 RepID=UPI00146DBA0B|nr:MFS transporter [Streptomyces sp. HNM0574]NLU70190.1 MFS transporter [Streptomyces sp. HNM0574]
MLDLLGPRLLVLSFLGRLPTSMCPIGTLLLIGHTSGSTAQAGLVAGALSLGEAAGGPLVGRFADRRGQRPVVLLAVLVNAAAVAALVTAAVTDAPVWLQVPCAGLAGLAVPQIAPLSRSRWLTMVKGHRDERRIVPAILSLEGAVDEINFTAGPALVGLCATFADPVLPMLLAVALVTTCGTLFALHPTATRGTSGERFPRRRDPGRAALASPALALLMLSMAMQGLLFGSVQTGVSATSAALGHPGAAGVLYGLMGGVSAVVGFALLALPQRVSLPQRLRLATGALLLLSLPLTVADTMTALTVATGLIGLAVAPHIITVFGLTERAAPRSRTGEAMGLLLGSLLVAQAAGTTLSGHLAETHGPTAPFWLTTTATATATLLALTTAGVHTRGRQLGAREGDLV